MAGGPPHNVVILVGTGVRVAVGVEVFVGVAEDVGMADEVDVTVGGISVFTFPQPDDRRRDFSIHFPAARDHHKK